MSLCGVVCTVAVSVVCLPLLNRPLTRPAVLARSGSSRSATCCGSCVWGISHRCTNASRSATDVAACVLLWLLLLCWCVCEAACCRVVQLVCLPALCGAGCPNTGVCVSLMCPSCSTRTGRTEWPLDGFCVQPARLWCRSPGGSCCCLPQCRPQ